MVLFSYGRGQVKLIILQKNSTHITDSVIFYAAHDYLKRSIQEPQNKNVWYLSEGTELSVNLKHEYNYLVIENCNFTNRNRPLLVKDNIQINLNIDKMGKVSLVDGQVELIDCQIKLANLNKYPRAKSAKINIEDLDNIFRARTSNIYLMDSILTQYVGTISDAEKTILRADCLTRINLALLSILGNFKSDIKTTKYAYEKFHEIINNERVELLTDDIIYPCLTGEYGFRRAYTDLKIRRNIYGQKYTYADIYDEINTNSENLLRDRSIAESILNEIQYDQFPINYLDSALTVLKDSLSRSVVLANKESRTIGKDLLLFDFEDTHGNDISLPDFKGKVVIVDFWYNGCLGCAKLSKGLEKVIENLHGQEVIFLSVNVDKKRSKWIDGIKLGIYTSSHSLNVYTKGLGYDHPFLLHYKYRSFPQLMIIDQNGKLVTSNATRPLNVEKSNQLIADVEKLLQ